MRRFIVRRLTHGAAVILIAASLAFVLIHTAPGDPFSSTLENPSLDPNAADASRAAYGFDRPLPEQFFRFITQLAVGNLGLSISYGGPVSAVLADVLPNTLLLMGVALLFSFAVGIAIGAWQAMHRDSTGDRVIGTTCLVIASLPEFCLGLVLMLTFGGRFGLPVNGTVDPMYELLSTGDRVIDRIRHLVLPALTLGLLGIAAVARYQRAALLEALPQDFIRTARAKGVAERWVVYRHALRNALVPTIVLLGLSLPTLLGGAVFVETLYAWNGMGSLAAAAFAARDYHLVLGAVLVGAVMVVLGGILTDLLHAVVDPRVRAR